MTLILVITFERLPLEEKNKNLLKLTLNLSCHSDKKIFLFCSYQGCTKVSLSSCVCIHKFSILTLINSKIMYFIPKINKIKNKYYYKFNSCKLNELFSLKF